MSEEMPYIPYGEGPGWQKRFEMTIPILVLILVIVIVAWKLGWLAGIPIINQFFKGSSIDIAIIGNDQNLVRVIETDIRRDLPVNAFPLSKSALENISDCSRFDRYNMIILTEGQDGDTIPLQKFTLECLRDFVNSGKPAIVIGKAGSDVIDSTGQSTGENGWTVLGFVPAICQTAGCETTSPSYERVSMFVKDINHPILQAFGDTLNFEGRAERITYYLVNPKDGDSILDMEIETASESYRGTAMVDRTVGYGTGKVVYFAFHPSLYSPLLYNSIKYLR